ncbi:zinc finger MYM-type protein 1-like [Macrobrachium rosenbergii]|uniref:zinc finger MYM-type protein 1-like n=1 Tax=Macrobrachium rosenbergii TaxID=79674 RepID=UPI0034D6A313
METTGTQEEDICLVNELLEKPFWRRSVPEKIYIIRMCRPCPPLPGLTKKHKEKNKEYMRHFNFAQYETTHWLTGSPKLNKLFCWPCLLFSNEDNIWSNAGFDNLNTLTLAVARHEKSFNHISCFLQYNSFVRTTNDHQTKEHQPMSDEMHNENVKKNREILKRLIDAVCFLSKQELPLRGRDESDTSVNKGNYLKLLALISHYDPMLEIRMQESTVFRDISPAIQNDLITVIGYLITKQIKEDIVKTDFVSVILDETSDVVNKSQMSTVFRFVDQNCEVQERFLHFTDISANRSSVGLLEHIERVLSDFGCGGKLVAQTYDGAVVVVSQQNTLNKRIQDLHPCAIFVHCYSHLLNLTLQQSAKNIVGCRAFLQTLSCLAAFFPKSSRKTLALKTFVEKLLPGVAPARWNFSSRLLNTVKEYYDPLTTFFLHVLNQSDDWDDDTVLKSRGFLAFFQSFQTRFLVNIFSSVFSLADVFFCALQNKGMDIAYCIKKVEELIGKIQKIREDGFDRIFQESSPAKNDENPAKKPRIENFEEEESFRALFCEILDNVLSQLRHRFRVVTQLDFFILLNSDFFEKHSQQFPESALKCLEKQYGSFFDIVRLKNELGVLYCSSEFRGKPVLDMMKIMHKTKLYQGLPEVYKLAKLIATIPATSAVTKRTSSSLKRIKTYCNSTQGQENLSSFALMSIEKTLLEHLKLRHTFYEDVTEKFIEKNGSVEFRYR